MSTDLHNKFDFGDTFIMVIIFLRALIILMLLIIVMRLMGKRQIGEMQPYEFIITLLIAEIACVPMSDVSIPLLYGISSILAVFILHQILTILEHSGQLSRKIINGKPSIVIDTKGVNITELKKNNLDVGDLIESLRSSGNFALKDIKYAVLESNGKLSVINYKEKQTDSLPILLINCGKTHKNNLSLIKYSNEKLLSFLKTKGIKKLKNVDVMTIDGNGNCYFQAKGESFRTFSMPIEFSW